MSFSNLERFLKSNSSQICLYMDDIIIIKKIEHYVRMFFLKKIQYIHQLKHAILKTMPHLGIPTWLMANLGI